MCCTVPPSRLYYCFVAIIVLMCIAMLIAAVGLYVTQIKGIRSNNSVRTCLPRN